MIHIVMACLGIIAILVLIIVVMRKRSERLQDVIRGLNEMIEEYQARIVVLVEENKKVVDNMKKKIKESDDKLDAFHKENAESTKTKIENAGFVKE